MKKRADSLMERVNKAKRSVSCRNKAATGRFWYPLVFQRNTLRQHARVYLLREDHA